MSPEDRLELIAMLAEDRAWDALIKIGEVLLDEYYPASVFTGESGGTGPLYIVALRKALEAICEE